MPECGCSQEITALWRKVKTVSELIEEPEREKSNVLAMLGIGCLDRRSCPCPLE